jgi:hypothetical protein
MLTQGFNALEILKKVYLSLFWRDRPIQTRYFSGELGFVRGNLGVGDP